MLLIAQLLARVPGGLALESAQQHSLLAISLSRLPEIDGSREQHVVIQSKSSHINIQPQLKFKCWWSHRLFAHNLCFSFIKHIEMFVLGKFCLAKLVVDSFGLCTHGYRSEERASCSAWRGQLSYRELDCGGCSTWDKIHSSEQMEMWTSKGIKAEIGCKILNRPF